VGDAAPRARERPAGVDDDVVEAIGKASEAFEHIERARGHLFSFHQAMGHADLALGEAADMLRDAGLADDADRLDDEVVGRNVLDGRWTFQIVEEFDDLYYEFVRDEVRALERRRLDGIRHLFESELKEARRSRARAHHEERPPASWSPAVETAGDPGPVGDPQVR
jgi:hypothetical protein